MAVISVEVPDTIAQKFEPFTIVQYDTFLSGAQEENIEFDFKKEDINQDEFVSYLKQ
ncbi:hypothetical protein MK079_03685 [Candidatus Gracilibacteria bacterium]|nr:hypothetical protein [Candidatus Gracilibacteria bacterium]